MIILQVSKIPDSAFTKCKVKIKKRVPREKIFASVDFCLYFCAIQKTHYCKYLYLAICFNCFSQTPFHSYISLD